MSIIKVNSIQPASGTTVSITGLSLEGTDIVSGSSIATSEQGAIALTTNGVAATELDLGVKTDDSPQFTGINLGHASDTTLTRASSGDVNIEGNLVYRAGGTDVPVADGGTGASSLTDGGVLLGSGTGAITAMSVLADGEMIVGDGTTDPVAESGATLRTSIGVGTGNSPQFTGIELGHASDSTITRVSAGVIAVEGATVRTGTVGVDVGGTGATSLTDGGILLGSGTDAVTAMAVLADGEMIVGDGTTDPVAESGATLRTSIGVGTGDSPQLTGIELGHASDTTLTRASSGDVNIEGNIVYRAGGTDVPVTDGGTGASSLTDGGVLLGSGTGAITAMGVLGDGEMIVGDGTGDPVAESGATLRTSIGVGTGDSPQFTNLVLSGDLTVAGTRTELQVAHLNVEDLNITVASGSADSAAADGAGLTVAGASATFTYSHSGTKWNMNKPLDVTGNIDSDGLLTITGTGTSQFSSHLQAHCLGIGTSPSGTTGEIRAAADITAYYSSDERLKENIIPLTGALDKVNALTGVSFDWKKLNEEQKNTIHSHEGKDIGVIAQEVQAQYPELVTTRDHGYLAVDYQKLSVVLIEAVKELSNKVALLESKI